jgi:hypothetical protein
MLTDSLGDIRYRDAEGQIIWLYGDGTWEADPDYEFSDCPDDPNYFHIFICHMEAMKLLPIFDSQERRVRALTDERKICAARYLRMHDGGLDIGDL